MEHWGIIGCRSINLYLENFQTSVCAPSGIVSAVIIISRRWLLSIAVLIALCVMPPVAAHAVNVSFGWDANSEPEVEGYVVYCEVDSPGPPYDYSDALPEGELPNPTN